MFPLPCTKTTFVQNVCLSSPEVRFVHLCPQEKDIEPLSLFQRKTLKSILKLSNTAPTPSIYFLCGELPVEANIHRDMFSPFYCVWSNPDTKVHQIVKYLLRNSNEHSRTWSENLKHIARMYEIEDLLVLIQQDPPLKSHFKNYIQTKITVFHEREFRLMATSNSQMRYLNECLPLRTYRQRAPCPVLSF